jgi:SAM-dependent methyltransferase
LGGVTLLPAGVGVMGSAAIREFLEAGISLRESVWIVSLIRLSTIGWALFVGTICLVREFGTLSSSGSHSDSHFNEIASGYRDQFPPHVWEHLLARRLELLKNVLPDSYSSWGLDLGCGLGQHCLGLQRLGYRVIGMDSSAAFVDRANADGVTAVRGTALSLPFRSEAFDFVYMIGTLHHLAGEEKQQTAIAEAGRVLKPGGIFVIQETNPRNPFFRFYMGYIFPLLKSIDEGTEWWIPPKFWANLSGMKLLGVRYFTFLPNFLPSFLMKPLLTVQHFLEAGKFQSYSIHYMVSLQKVQDKSL